MASKLRSKLNKEALSKRVEESYNRKDDSGKFRKIWKEDAEISFWKCGEGDHIIDIIPFLAGSQHPQQKEGTPTYLVDLWVHYGVGVGEDTFVCPARNYDERCPICEYVTQLRKEEEPDNDRIKELIPRRRAIYNIICYDNSKEEDKGIQIWDASHYLTEKNFLALARNPRGGGFASFADPDEGMSISFVREGQGAINTKYLGFKFVERDYVIHDDELDAAHIIDELFVIPSYDELKDAFQGGYQYDEEQEYTGTGDDVPTFTEDEEVANAAGDAEEQTETAESELDPEAQLDDPPEPEAAPTRRRASATDEEPPKRTVRTAKKDTAGGRGLRPTSRQRRT